jgi:hypothetical protein
MLQNEHAINYKIKIIHFEIFIIDSQQKEKGWSDSVRIYNFICFSYSLKFQVRLLIIILIMNLKIYICF